MLGALKILVNVFETAVEGLPGWMHKLGRSVPTGLSLHSGLSAPPPASQASAPGGACAVGQDRLGSTEALGSKKALAGPIPLNYQVRHTFFSFFLPHFLGAPRGERPLLPRRADALWEGPVPFGRNRESRSREAAGRRNWPEAVPKKTSRRKR
jgi:hypothetical protein